MKCLVCGHVDGACKGDTRTNTRQIITSNGVVTEHGLPRVPINSRGRIGKAGYVGAVELYDPKAPNIRFVQPELEEAEISGDGSGEAPPVIEAATVAVERTAPSVRSAAAPRRTRKKAE